MNYKEQMKEHQIHWKENGIVDHARAADRYLGQKEKTYRHCIQNDFADEQLFQPIREIAKDYFDAQKIVWHGGNKQPSNNLLDSQISFINFMEPLTIHPDTLLKCIQVVFPEASALCGVEMFRFLDYEYIGKENYLNERVAPEGRKRGENCTSADGFLIYKTSCGKKVGVLIEWKFTESYGGDSNRVKVRDDGSMTDRYMIYKSLLKAKDSPFKYKRSSELSVLFQEPLYQFTRLCLLAKEMAKVREYGIDECKVLLLSPSFNHALIEVKNRLLSFISNDIREVFSGFLNNNNLFNYSYWEGFFEPALCAKIDDLRPWQEYIKSRYLI